MTKRILTLMGCVMLLLAFSVQAFAYASKSGSTSGGRNGVLNTTATLSVSSYTGQATTNTSASNPENVSYATTINCRYYNANNHVAYVSGSGTKSAGASASRIVDGTSQHSVNGGTYWGNWSCTLSD